MFRKYVCMAVNSERNMLGIINCYCVINDTMQNAFSKQLSTIIFFHWVIRHFSFHFEDKKKNLYAESTGEEYRHHT